MAPILLAVGSGCRHAAEPQGPLTFNRDIAPIMFAKCSVCHRPGEAAPFSLLGYDDFKKRADQIELVTGSRFMPPWLPAPGLVAFEDDRSLSEEQIDRIARWIEEGCLEGDPADLPPAPTWPDGWQLGTPDLVITMPEPYELGPDGPDVYRNFLIPVPLDRDRWIKTWEFRPGNPRAVHHAGMRIDRTSRSRLLERKDPVPGFVSSTMTESPGIEGSFSAWQPGSQPFKGSDEIAARLEKGTDFVVQLHMNRTGKVEEVQSSVGLYFADKPPTLRPMLARLGPFELDIPAGKSDYEITDSFTLPVDVLVLGVSPHAHYLATDMKGWAILPDGSRQWLIHIPAWDFNWQGAYRYKEPIRLPRGTVIHQRFLYDNSADNVRNPNQPPKRVLYGPDTTDEMCGLWLLLQPANDDDWDALDQACLLKELNLKIERWKNWIQTDRPGVERLDAYNNLGMTYLTLGRYDLAADYLRQAIELEPQSAEAHYNLGIVHGRTGKTEAAMREYEAAIEADPEMVDAHTNLGALLQTSGRLEEAIRHYECAIAILPDANLHNNLGLALMAQKKTAEAIRHYRLALEHDRGSVKAHLNLGIALIETQRADEALEHLERAASLSPRDPEMLNGVATVYLSLGRLEEAERHFRQALAANPRFARAHNGLGKIHLARNDPAGAIRSFETALEIRSDYAEARRNLETARRASTKGQ